MQIICHHYTWHSHRSKIIEKFGYETAKCFRWIQSSKRYKILATPSSSNSPSPEIYRAFSDSRTSIAFKADPNIKKASRPAKIFNPTSRFSSSSKVDKIIVKKENYFIKWREEIKEEFIRSNEERWEVKTKIRWIIWKISWE